MSCDRQSGVEKPHHSSAADEMASNSKAIDKDVLREDEEGLAKPKTETDAEAVGEGAEEMPTAGPHAKPGLTNSDATPGSGSLPDERGSMDVDGGAG